MAPTDFGLRDPRPRAREELPTWREMVLSVGFAVFSFGMGLTILLGGERRFSNPGYLVQRQLMPWWGWAATFLVYGAVVAVTMRRVWHWATLFLGSLLYVVFGAAALVSVHQSPSDFPVSYVGPWIWCWFVGMHLYMAYRRFHKSLERTDPLRD